MLWLLSQLDQQAFHAAMEEAGSADESGPGKVLIELHAQRVRLFEDSLTEQQAQLLSGIAEIQTVMDGCMNDTLFLQGLVLGALIQAGLPIDYRAVVEEAAPSLLSSEEGFEEGYQEGYEDGFEDGSSESSGSITDGIDQQACLTLSERLGLAGVQLDPDELDELIPETAMERFREFVDHVSPDDFRRKAP